MAIVEDHRVAQVVVGRAVKGFLAPKAGKQHFSQGPTIIEVIQRLRPSAICQIRECQRGNRPI